MASKIQLRRDTAANWTAVNPVLALGEPGIEMDTGKVKYGDGTTAWTALSYSAGGTGATGPQGYTGSAGSNGVSGAVGFTGSAGSNGVSGAVGFTGSAGSNGVSGAVGFTGSVGATGPSAALYLLEAYANVTYTLPGTFTEDPCRYSVVSNTVNVSSAWFNTSTYTFTPQKAGYWEIIASYDVYRNSEASIAIKKNGSIVAAAGSFNAVAQQIRKIVYLNGSTDYINIHNVGGAALQRAQYDSRSWFQARWIGE